MSVEPTPRRLFLHDSDWRVGLKKDSLKEYCYSMAPGQDYYHRLATGEIYLHRADERLCLACAERRGLLSYEAKSLRDPIRVPAVEAPDPGPVGEAEEEWGP